MFDITPYHVESPSSGRSTRNSDGFLPSRILKRSTTIGGHKSSISLEQIFWDELKRHAADMKMPIGRLIAQIDSTREHTNLSSAIRVFVMQAAIAA